MRGAGPLRPRPPPVAALAAGFGGGCALILSGAVSPAALPLLALAILPAWPFLRPQKRLLALALVAAALAGALRADAWRAGDDRDCRYRISSGPVEGVAGRFLGRPGDGATPFRLEDGLPGGCAGEVRAYLEPEAAGAIRPGVRVHIRGVWRRLPPRRWTTPERAGYLVVEGVEAVPEGGVGRGWTVRIRGRAQERLLRLFEDRSPVTEALVLARKENLDPELRDAFARAGIAHLLAISGFHVGIVAGLVLTLARLVGAGPRRAPALAAGAAGAYVLAIGSPDAAVRAALLLALLAAGPLRRRPVMSLGALATAFLGFLLVDPGALGRAGFQLSFAGVAGLMVWSRRWSEEIRSWGRSSGDDPGARGALGRWATGGGRWRLRVPGPLADGLGAALAATVATLPLVAWHFGRVPLLSVPATLLLGPLVALAIPGIFACLLLDAVAPGAAAFLAGGVGLLLEAVVRASVWTAALPGAAPWVSRGALAAAGSAGLGGWLVLRGRTGLSRRARRVGLLAAVVSGLLLAPVVGVPGSGGDEVEIAVVDVGQGDALAVRSPRSRWILVDAGPRSPSFDAGARRVVPFLKRRGVERLEALVLTHPDLDHVGGAPAVLESLVVGGVLDPGWAAGRAPYQAVLEAAERLGVGWWPAGARRRLELDGMELRVLHPLEATVPEGGGRAGSAGGDRGSADRTGSAGSSDGAGLGVEANDRSVVLLVRYGHFRALLTGDAPAAVEESVVGRIHGPVQVLKVGHHGSATSTSRALVESLGPEAAVIPVGWRNRYGHPHADVLARLARAGARVYRTDLHGTVRIRGRRDGSWSVELPDRRGGEAAVRGRSTAGGVEGGGRRDHAPWRGGSPR